jgi:uncharacterized protein YeaO (DUF488 family)
VDERNCTSDQPRECFAHDPKRWVEFQERYREDLKTKAELVDQLRELERRHGTVTLIYSTRDDQRNQAAVLFAFLQGST